MGVTTAEGEVAKKKMVVSSLRSCIQRLILCIFDVKRSVAHPGTRAAAFSAPSPMRVFRPKGRTASPAGASRAQSRTPASSERAALSSDGTTRALSFHVPAPSHVQVRMGLFRRGWYEEEESRRRGL